MAVSVCGVSVHPGDLILGDDDGVFVVNPKQAEAIGLKALEKQHREAAKRKELGYTHFG
ncbi:RraA family protein [Paenibacillus hexagrammi]|uniref:hypothetical protein n=1 Tax=Paenibacillus hexagrammi TaxID=2908839 RepID=UPI0021A92E66|nr:hypothetical protein [Paenibacillus sp. YPD9-1]